MTNRLFLRGEQESECVCFPLSLGDSAGHVLPPVIAQLVERQTVDAAVICWSLVRFRVTGLSVCTVLPPCRFSSYFLPSMGLLHFCISLRIGSCGASGAHPQEFAVPSSGRSSSRALPSSYSPTCNFCPWATLTCLK